MIHFDLLHASPRIVAFSGEQALVLNGDPARAGDVQVALARQNGLLAVDVTAERTPLDHVHLRWNLLVPAGLRILGDAWERGYGDLEWRGMVPERVLPWYFLACDGQSTAGCGVKTGAGALCFWRVDAQGVSLWLDLRCGGQGVELRGRTLRAAEVVSRAGVDGERPFAAAQALCAALCDAPRLPQKPVYGSNNWYYAYGVSSHAEILDDTRLLMSLAPAGDNPPYMVIDAGWQPLSGDPISNCICGGPYDIGCRLFPDMPGLAAQIGAQGALPGIWIRPLGARPDTPESMLLPASRAVDSSALARTLDPSIPEVLEQVRADFRLLHDWGYALIKHDWSTCDLLGRWGFQMGAALTNPGWRFSDSTRTTAEITRSLYAAIRQGAEDALVIGCNTIGHLGAGLFELQRTGDDTSGRVWERTRKYGVNTLAFRAAQHGTFFAADADCVGHTGAIPWELNARWLDLLARSGTPLFVSVDPKLVDGRIQGDLRAAFAAAAVPQPLAEPLDWLETTCPTRWQIGAEQVCYDWTPADGLPLQAQSIPMWWGM